MAKTTTKKNPYEGGYKSASLNAPIFGRLISNEEMAAREAARAKAVSTAKPKTQPQTKKKTAK